MMKNSYIYLLTPFLAWFVAQGLKSVVNKTRAGSAGIGKYLRSGDMPSAHTAVVTALASVIFVREGVTPLFAVVVWFAAITIYDSLVARRSIGEQGQALTKLLRHSEFAKDPLPSIAMGHKPAEVAAGLCIGVLIGVIVAIA